LLWQLLGFLNYFTIARPTTVVAYLRVVRRWAGRK
jgi:hypothetical protein